MVEMALPVVEIIRQAMTINIYLSSSFAMKNVFSFQSMSKCLEITTVAGAYVDDAKAHDVCLC